MALVDTNDKPRLPVPALIALCAAAVLIAVFAAWRSLAPRQPMSALTPAQTKAAGGMDQQTTEWMRQKAQASGGDVNKLTPEDQSRLHALTRGNGGMVLRTMAGK